MAKLNKINLNGTEILLEQLSKYINILEPDENGNLDIKNIPNHTWTLIPVGGMLGGYDTSGNFVTNGCSFYNSNGGDTTSERLNTVRIINMGRYSNYCYIKMIWFAPNASTWSRNGIASGIMYGTAGPSSYSDTSLPGLSFSGLLDNNSLKSNSLNISGLWTFSNSSAIPRLSNDTTPLTPTDARHIVNKAYVDLGDLLNSSNNTYILNTGIRYDMGLTYTDETTIAKAQEIMDDYYPKFRADSNQAAMIFAKDYTMASNGVDIILRGKGKDFYYTYPERPSGLASDPYGQRGHLHIEGTWDGTEQKFTVSSVATIIDTYTPTQRWNTANKAYVDDKVAEEVSTPVITLDISQMISPTECTLTQEQRAIVEDDSIGVLYIDGTSLGNPKGIFYKTRIYTTDNVDYVELTSVLYNGNIIVVATGVYNSSTGVATLEYKNILTIDNTSAYTPTQQYHPATKGYVDLGDLLNSSNNTYILSAGIRYDMGLTYTDSNTVAAIQAIMDDYYPKYRANTNQGALIFGKDYTTASNGCDIVLRGVGTKFYYVYPYRGDLGSYFDDWGKTGCLTINGSWDESTSKFTVSSASISVSIYTPTNNANPANKKYVDDKVAASKTLPTITIAASQIVSTEPVIIAMTTEQQGILENSNQPYALIDGTVLGLSPAYSYKAYDASNKIYITGYSLGTNEDQSGNLYAERIGTILAVYDKTTKQMKATDADPCCDRTPVRGTDLTNKTYVDTAIAAAGGGGGLPSLTLSDTIFELVGDTESAKMETTDVEAIFAFANGLNVGDGGNKQIILNVTDHNNMARQFIAILHRTMTDTQTVDTDAITINCYDNAAMLFTIYASTATEEGKEDVLFGSYDSLWLADSITINDMMGEINNQMSANTYALAGIRRFISSSTYNKGDYVFNSDDMLIYKCNTDNTTGDFDPTYWDEVSYMDYMREQLIGNALGGSY